MKRIVLVRHAKAVQWGYEDDFTRELTERGEKDAAKVSSSLMESGIHPDGIVTSPATRAWQTASCFASVFRFPEDDIKTDRELYHGYTTGEFVTLIHSFPDEEKTVFIFGHNPSFEYYATGLCRSFNGEMATCSAVVIDFTVDRWKEVQSRSGLVFKQVNPKELNS